MKKNIYLFLIAFLLTSRIISQTLISPQQDYVLRFAGEQYAAVSENNNFNLTNQFTMMGWVYVEKVTPGSIFMGCFHNSWLEDPGVAYTLGITNFDDNNEFEFLLSDGTSGNRHFIFGGKVLTNQWVHLAATFGNNKMKIYINGEVVDSTEFNSVVDPNRTRFGVGGGVTEDPSIVYQSGFTGYMKQISVWNIALSGQEIKNVAENNLTGNKNGLLAYWKLDDGSGEFAKNEINASADLRFDQNAYQPDWRENDPIWYIESAIDDPYFKVSEFPWYETIGNPNYTVQDVYPIDFNRDGLIDVVLSYVEWPAEDIPKFVTLNALKNNGDGTFTNVTNNVLGNVQVVLPRFGQVADFNNDGYEDIFLVDSGTDCCGSPGNQNTLLLGKSNGTLINASFTNLPNFSDANHALAVGDIDNDGDLDIISAQQGRPLYPSGSVENKPEIYINDGTGNFELDYSRWPESQDLESGTAVALIDFDRDGLRDVVFSGQYSPLGGSYPRQALVLMRNKGNGFFEFTDGTMRNSELAAVKTNNGYEEHVEMKVADVNADGWEDLLVCLNLGSYKGARIDLYLNDKQGNLVKKINGFQSDQFGEKSTNFWYIYLKPADFNSDGWIDILVEGQEAGDLLFLNNGDGTFKETSDILSPSTFAWNSASGVADFTNNGREDIFSVSHGRIQLLENFRDYVTTSSHLNKPEAPNILKPITGENISADVIFEWSENTPFAQSQIQVASDENFTTMIYELKDYTGLRILIPGLDVGNTYYWRVRGQNSAGDGEWSPTQSFLVDEASAIDDETENNIPESFVLKQNFPNPFNPETNISFELPEELYVKLEIFDILGERITELVNSKQLPGHYTVSFDGSHLPSGIYLYRIKAGKFIQIKKMILLK